MKKLILVAFITLPMLAHAQPFKYQKDISNFKQYKGDAILTGTYSRTLDPEYLDYMGDGICFEPDQKSSALVPRPKGDERTAWFCFSNFEQAKKTFKLPDTIKKDYCKYEGKAIITIKDYNLFVEETEGSDLTQLVSAKNITPAKAVKCETNN
ncbi:hypothetical protein ABFY41_10755 [Acinetobacter haemolyticus]|uniref:hypothetical protein n=1 Tax=Acinetobacter haemolyticus TaxID=29430 RepID=UPI002A69A55D|nr:hypothetical protein [Acinetobacter haemolyticus]WPO66365.1 hypothetical protein SDC64_10505 [Acinetobacter haemolyticus]